MHSLCIYAVAALDLIQRLNVSKEKTMGNINDWKKYKGIRRKYKNLYFHSNKHIVLFYLLELQKLPTKYNNETSSMPK